jgi:AcrR family transcriptional regulator
MPKRQTKPTQPHPGQTSPTPSDPRQKLSRERVIAQAVAVADLEGIAGLSMRRLAEALGVEAMSLYHHVANKERLLDAMVDVVFAEVEPPAQAHWREGLAARAHSMRVALLRHRWALGLMESRLSPGPATLGHHNAVIGCLRSHGFSVVAAASAYSLLDSYIYGFVLQELNLPFTTAEQAGPVGEQLLAAVAAGDYPHLLEMAAHSLGPGWRG